MENQNPVSVTPKQEKKDTLARVIQLAGVARIIVDFYEWAVKNQLWEVIADLLRL